MTALIVRLTAEAVNLTGQMIRCCAYKVGMEGWGHRPSTTDKLNLRLERGVAIKVAVKWGGIRGAVTPAELG